MANMQPSDFGVDIEDLPKLVLDEDAGRKTLVRLNTVAAFRIAVLDAKLAFFGHYVRDHLDIDIGNAMDERETMLELTKKHEITWNGVSRVIDRHVFLLVTAMRSFDVNTLDNDDLDIVGCAAYGTMFRDVVFGGIEGDEIGITLRHRANNNKLSVVDVINDARGAMQLANKQGAVFTEIVKQYIKGSAENPHYGEGIKLGR